MMNWFRGNKTEFFTVSAAFLSFITILGATYITISGGEKVKHHDEYVGLTISKVYESSHKRGIIIEFTNGDSVKVNTLAIGQCILSTKPVLEKIK